mmetsp:Transcript_54063/g.105776  ORF Transcript_54063/g.105776 Transcript_54063/m.105776 type:complete len:234 (-) Transcript_54063:692-1393(-)
MTSLASLGTATGRRASGGNDEWRPQRETGSTRTPAFSAIFRVPGLNFLTRPSRDRVSSANAQTDAPSLRRLTVSLKVFREDRLSPLWIATWRAICMAHPSRGIERTSTFEMYLNLMGRKAESTGMSRNEEWLATISRGSLLSFGRFSRPSTLGFSVAFHKQNLDHTATTMSTRLLFLSFTPSDTRKAQMSRGYQKAAQRNTRLIHTSPSPFRSFPFTFQCLPGSITIARLFSE